MPDIETSEQERERKYKEGFDAGFAEGYINGFAEGAAKARDQYWSKFVRWLLEQGKTEEEIALALDTDIEKVLAIIEKLNEDE